MVEQSGEVTRAEYARLEGCVKVLVGLERRRIDGAKPLRQLATSAVHPVW